MIITLNEEEMLPSALQSAQKLNPAQIVVVDGGSQDRTRDIVQEFRKEDERFELYLNPMPHSFARQRNFALSRCRGNWVLALDSDETIHPSAAAILPQLAQHNTLSFWFPRYHLFPDAQHALPSPPNHDLQCRFFQRIRGIFFSGNIHEILFFFLTNMADVRRLYPHLSPDVRTIPIFHWGYMKSREALIQRGQRWQRWKKERGVSIGDEYSFILDKEKEKVYPLAQYTNLSAEESRRTLPL